MGRAVIAYLAAVAVAFAAASFAHTQMILNDLVAMGVPVDLSLRFSQAIEDMVGLLINGAAPALFPAIIAIGLVVALPLAGLVARLAPGLRVLVFMTAGAVAMFAIFTALKISVGSVGLFGARGALGLALQMGAGALGGLTFALLKPRGE